MIFCDTECGVLAHAQMMVVSEVCSLPQAL